jgi:undecaprenyl-diphosphatase
LLIVWALLVGFSRVFVGKHFLGDVLVGFVIGALIAYLICLLGEFICKKIKN